MDWPFAYTNSFGTYVKIGLSRDPGGRPGELQTGNPFKLKLQKCYKVKCMKWAEEDAYAHNAASAYKTNGGGKEWFHVPKGVDLNTLIKKVDDELKKKKG